MLAELMMDRQPEMALISVGMSVIKQVKYINKYLIFILKEIIFIYSKLIKFKFKRNYFISYRLLRELLYITFAVTNYATTRRNDLG